MARDTVTSSRPDCSALAGVVSFARPLPSLAVTPGLDPPIGAPSAFTGAVSGARSSPFPDLTPGHDTPSGVPAALAGSVAGPVSSPFPAFTLGPDPPCGAPWALAGVVSFARPSPSLAVTPEPDPSIEAPSALTNAVASAVLAFPGSYPGTRHPQRGTVGSSRHCCQCWPSPVPFPLRGSAPDEQVPFRALSPLLPVASVCTPGVFPGPTQPKLGLRLFVRILTYTTFKPAAGLRPFCLCRQGVWRRRQEKVNQGLSRGSTQK